jgi:hypothetical protein
MRSKDAFPSQYLGSTDLKGKEPNVTIERLYQEEIGNDRQLKWILKFKTADKPMILNKTNWDRIEFMYGDSDDWPGCRVQLYTEMVSFQGKTVEAIRIRRPTTAAPPQATPEQPRRIAATAPNDGLGQQGHQFASQDRGTHKISTTEAIQQQNDDSLDEEIPF